ncbi:class I SAM-dependent methyltransferase [Amycolatopsis rhizosphaerae]|uniref:Class I SAM-dependent methyltransferase n=2 Tax=Amycolatopsis rhizosphaerae TaxID=2053003 RepID=A0A558CRC7_9PSEU|nr:class I SAM-dependent methyltransferase [Amycolatopsis rhizosphaerae]
MKCVDTSRNAAGAVHALVRAVLGSEIPLMIRCWDGSEAGPPDAPVRLVLRRRRALRRLLWAPSELGLARAYVSGDLDVETDFFESLSHLERIIGDRSGPWKVDATTKREMLRAGLRLGVLGLPPRPPAEEIRLGGRRHSRGRDARAISHHYDVGNDFYRLVLGPSMTYSCAVWDDGAKTLEDAQTAKVDLVARKLGLREGMRVLDVGCGWGAFVIHAAREYGVRAVGITLSQSQAEFARKRVAEEGLSDRVEIRVQDYREVRDGPYDAIASIGMAEHVGEAMLPTYASALYALLRPEGRLLNHAISRKAGIPGNLGRTSFINRYVFPDGELEPLTVMVGAIEESGFEVRDVESLREHYALTLRAWVANLEASWAEAVRLTSEGRARVWRLYMAACALTFERGSIGINQVLAVKPGAQGASGMPRTRTALLS